MHYRRIQARGVARQFVECYWTLDVDSGDDSVQRIVPDGCSELILNLGQPFESLQADGGWKVQPDCFFAGQITGPLLVRPAGLAKILGIRFRPHCARALLDVPMHELTGSIRALDEISPALSREVERIRERSSVVDQIAGFEALLRSRDDDVIVSQSVETILRSGGMVDLGRLADGMGVSLRQLERRFKDEVGLLPKLFSRIQRFQRVFHAIEGDARNWVDAAITCGYYDQAHLIRDFKDFSGEPPAALLAEADLAAHFLRYSRMSLFSNTQAAALS